MIGLGLACVCVSALGSSIQAGEMNPPTGLLCSLLRSPEKSLITEAKPDFGWIVPSAGRGDQQTAYRILVASAPEHLQPGKADFWDSGKVDSDQSINVIYVGKPLASNTSYWWRVKIWNKDGDPSPFSEPQRFNVGELDRKKDWPAESRWVEVAHASGDKAWSFEDRPPVKFHAYAPRQIFENTDRSWFIDFNQAAFATLEITLEWHPDQTSTTEHIIELALGEKNQGTTVDPSPGGGIIYKVFPLKIVPGKHSYQLQIPRHKAHYPHSQTMPEIMPEVLPFRYCQIMPKGESIEVIDAVQRRLWVDFDDTAAAFISSDQLLNAVYELCKYSAKVNTFNGDYAASQRERMMYEADSYIHQLSHYATDRNFATARYSTENQIFHASWPTEWIAHSIFMTWADYLHTGNARSMARFYDELKPKTLLALRDQYNLISTRTGKADQAFLDSIHLNKRIRDIVDWPKGERDNYDFQDYNTVVNAFHYQALILMSRIAAALEKESDAVLFRNKAEQVREAVNQHMWDEQQSLYIDGIGSEHISFHANLFPLAFGMVPEARRQSVVDYLISRGMACSVYPTVYLLEALFDAGEAQAAIDLMTATHDRSWMHMINVGSTVTTEAWDIKYKGNSGWTHAWSSAPAQILPRKLMGIEPLEPGFAKIRIHPRPGDVTWAWTRLPTIRGSVEAAFVNEAGRPFELTVTLPANMVARIELPLPLSEGEVLMDGEPIKFRKENGTAIVEWVGSGTYKFESRLE